MSHPIRYNQNVSGVPVPICDACQEGYCTACEGGNCACQWTHYGPDWDENGCTKPFGECSYQYDYQAVHNSSEEETTQVTHEKEVPV